MRQGGCPHGGLLRWFHPRKSLAKTRKILLVSNYLGNLENRRRGERTPTADNSPPRGRRREQSMIITRLAVIVVALMALAVPGIRGTLMVLDARRRAGSPPPRTQEQ